MNAPDPELEKETVFLHDLSPQIERELTRRARDSGRDTSVEAAEIIERHVEEAERRA